MKSKTHQMTVTIEFPTEVGSTYARNKLQRWLNTNGHTAAGHGFEFTWIGRLDSYGKHHHYKMVINEHRVELLKANQKTWVSEDRIKQLLGQLSNEIARGYKR